MRKTAVAALAVIVLIALVFVLLVRPLGLPGGGAAQPTASNVQVAQVDTSHYPQVTLYVRVDDGSGNPRPGLLQKDFALTEDGQPVDISGFGGSGASEVSTLLMIDTSGSMNYSDKMEGAQDAARSYVEQMRPADHTALLTFADDIQLVQPFTNDATQLQKAIGRLRADGGTPLYDALVEGVDALEHQPGRRALLLLTDGRDDPGSQATVAQAIDRAKQAGLDVQVIGLGDRDQGGNEGIDEAVLQRIASETGGHYFYTPSADQLAALYASLGGSLHQEYALTYTSPRPNYDGTRRDIRISVAGMTSAGGYTEQHLINVSSNSLVGLALLLPLLGALAAPGLIRRRGARQLPSAPPDSPTTSALPIASSVAQTPVLAAESSSGDVPIIQPPPKSTAKRLQPEMMHTCPSCGASLRPNARFCNTCGAAQLPAGSSNAPTQRIFCDHCGRPLLPGARFCDQCGATAPEVEGKR